MKLRRYQQSCVDEIRQAFSMVCKKVLLVSPTGSGKCLGRGTPVLMYDGTIKPVEFVVAGDVLMGPDSRPRNVLSTTTGREAMYRIIPTKGDSYTVNESHILSLRMTGGSLKSCGIADGTIINMEVRDYLKSTRTFRHCAKGWRSGVEFDTDPVFEPYILGMWLGDGASKGLSFTTGDTEVESAIYSFSDRLNLSVRREQNSKNSVNLYIVERPGSKGWSGRRGARPNGWLRDMGLINNKHIPHEYKTASRADRLELLAGILDADGHLSGGIFDLTLKNERLFDDVIFLARSLGFACYKKEVRKECVNNGVWGDYFRCSISGNVSEIPCKISRKQAFPRLQIKDVTTVGIKVEPIGEGEYFGFEIDGDRLFMLGDFTVTHNTVVFSYLARGVRAKNKRVYILVHRDELVEQVSETLGKFDVSHGIIAAGRDATANPVQVCSVFSLVNRLDDYTEPDLIICDEAHHASGGSTWGRIFKAWPNAYVLGVTATPIRLDGKPLKGSFEHMVQGPTVAELMESGDLCPYTLYAPPVAIGKLKKRMGDYVKSEAAAAMDKPQLVGNAVEHYKALAAGKRAIVFCVSLEHAENTAAAFRSAGFEAARIDGGMDRAARKQLVRRFSTGEVQVLTSCELVSEGFDLPAIEVAILMRPTASLALYLQQVGRALRTFPGKDRAIILDHAGNAGVHGLPDDDREWCLEGEDTGRKGKAEPTLRLCGKCFAHCKSGTLVCTHCGWAWPAEAREVVETTGELEVVTPEEVQRVKLDMKREVGMAKTAQELIAIEKARGYKPGWHKHILAARGGVRQ